MKRHLATIKESARRLKVNEMTLRALAKKGELKTIRKGRFLYLDPKAAFNFVLDQKFYTIEEIARLFKISHITVRKLLAQNKLKALKIGVLYRIPEQEVLKFTNQKKAAPLLDIKDLQKELQKSRLTVLKLIASGRIAAFKIGRLHRTTQEALQAYFKSEKRNVYTVAQTAGLLKVSSALVRQLIKTRRLEAKKIGKSYFVKEGALFVFIRNQEA